KFYKAARSKGIKPIVGCDVWIAKHAKCDKPSRLLLLVKNHAGYLQLRELLTQAWLANQHLGRAEIRVEWLAALPKGAQSGLIALSGAQSGDIGMALDNGNVEAARECAKTWSAIFPDHFYIEIQRANQPHMTTHVKQSVALAAKLNLPVVATHPIQF